MLTSSLRTKIITLQSQYPNLEVEARYGTFENGKFTPGVSLQTFARIRETLGKTSEVTVETSEDRIGDDIRETIHEGKSTWINKKRLLAEDISSYGLRIGASQETPISPIPNFTPTHIRRKVRYSYLIVNGAVRVDLTREENHRVVHEVEVELIVIDAFDAFSKSIELILKLVQDTHILYTMAERKLVIDYFNNLLTGGNRKRIDFTALKQGRGLKFRDMVWGGLIGNERTGYFVSNKADGVRKILFFAPNGIWLLMPPYEFTRLTTENYPTLTGTALDGELISKEKRKPKAPKEKYWFLAFDTLAWQGEINVQKQPHDDRMRLAQITADRIVSVLLKVNTMTFKSFDTSERFFQVMRDMFDYQKTMSYETDGFMFGPETADYDPKVMREGKLVSVDQLPLSQRVLTAAPDNVKWKPSQKLTIDFLIRHKEGNIELYVNQYGAPVLFTGSYLNPFDGIIPTPDFLKDVQNNSIVEFKWDEQFIPQRIRLDKFQPNKKEIATDIWDDIHHPIREELLRGKTFDLLKYYLSRIRRRLLKGGETLLDINSGKGGDVSRWSSYSRIVAFEENSEERKELERRIKLNHLEKRVKIVETKEGIVPAVHNFLGKAETISLVKKMESFWTSEKELKTLVGIIEETLSPSGEIVFLTLDGDAITELFHPAYTYLTVKEIDLKFITISFDGRLKIRGHIEEDISPVYLSNLLAGISLYLSEIHRGDTEAFLTPEEKIMGRLYSWGRISRGKIKPLVSGEGKTPYSSSQTRPLIPSVVQERSEKVANPKPLGSPVNMVVPTTLSPKVSPPYQNIERRKVKEYALRSLPVINGRGDDLSERVNLTWFNDVFRIACIGDGSCFFHALLKGFYDVYQENPNYKARSQLVKELRNELASVIGEEDPDNPGKLYYETVADGAWPRMAKEQKLMTQPLLDDYGEPLDYTLEGIISLFLSDRDVGDEVYSFISEIFGIGIYILRGTVKDLYPQISIGIEFPSIIIVGNGHHYELIAVMRGGAFQTFFYPEDPFLEALRKIS